MKIASKTSPTSLATYLNPMHKSSASAGFTLIEVLVAMSLFAIMSIMAYGGLESVMGSHEQTRTSRVAAPAGA